MAAKYVWIKLIGMGGERLELEPRWWPEEVLCADPRFSQSNETGSYNDWDAKLSIAEFRELHERFRPEASKGIFADADWQAINQPQLQIIDLAINGALRSLDRAEVGVHEWESGF